MGGNLYTDAQGNWSESHAGFSRLLALQQYFIVNSRQCLCTGPETGWLWGPSREFKHNTFFSHVLISVCSSIGGYGWTSCDKTGVA